MGWWSKEEKPEPFYSDAVSMESHKTIHAAIDRFYDVVPLSKPDRERFHASVDNLAWTNAHYVFLGTTSLLSFVVGVKTGRVRPVWRQLTALQDLHSSEIGPHAPWLRGTAMSVSDGDTIRFLHRPMWWSPRKPRHKDHKLAIRLATIDTPETAKFGKPGQPFGEEAKEYLTDLCLDKTVKIQILQIDQYGRGVAQVVRPRLGGIFGSTYMDEAMLRAGLAEVYQGTGAVYGRLGLDRYLKLVDKARRKKKGMWQLEDRETAAEYKQRTK